MSTVKQLSEEIAQGLTQALPNVNKPVVRKLSLAVGAMIEGRTPNTVELSNLLPLPLERQDQREQWLRRLLSSPALCCETVIEPFAQEALRHAGQNGQMILLSLDQTDLGDRMAVLMLTVRIGDRSLPLAWLAEAGQANIGFHRQKILLDKVLAWISAGAAVMLLADRFYPSLELFQWLKTQSWHYRLRLKGNLVVDTGRGDETTTAHLAQDHTQRYWPNVRLFGVGEVMTNIGIIHDEGHPEPWIIAMDCPPTRAAVLDYGSRWAIEPTFSDFKSRGFQLEDSHLRQPARLERLILIMALAMHWCVRVGYQDAVQRPTPLEKKPHSKPTPRTGALQNSGAVWSPGSHEACDT
ncbi:transposase [Candidatus Methylobacter oryzae]|uniref:Transposase n=1 Tax=Candidatus Methylobacter oryzae TaxID=2497749 RepID=A0ABY3CCU4_9GAMM|nr:transposase [Candidatus Methylobacter oryzae]TRX00316.1 transposase [Candidatus Methylobacter oryzae]